MKKYFVLMFMLLLVSLVFANNKIKVDVSLEEKILVPVAEKDFVEFYLNNSRHIIKIDKVLNNSLDVAVFLFVDQGQRVSYATLSKGNILKVDLNKDGKGELFLGYGGHFGNKTLLLMYNPNLNSTINGITGSVINEKTTPDEKNNNVYYIVSIIAVIIILISILAYINFRKKEV